MASLSELLPNYPLMLPEQTITGIKLDSRQVAGGDLFVAVSGYQTDGRHFIAQAISAGAAAILAEADAVEIEWQQGCPVVHVPQLRQRLSQVAARFYQQPSAGMQVIGVTGTNGKTSVTHIAAQLSQIIGHTAAVVGTTGSGLIGRLLPEQHTTPDAVTVQQRLATLKAEGAERVAMEVSSHALVQWRVEALQFSSVVATNISRDHLDYHGTLENYAKAKKRLFEDLPHQHKVLNADDQRLANWLLEWPESWSFGLSGQPRERHLWATDIAYHDGRTEFTLCCGEQRLTVVSPLLGEFNIYNLLAAMTALHAQGETLQALAASAKQLSPVPGRMEAFHASGKPLVVVDYAHTPDALQQVLQATRRHCRGQLWCVFGCGGDRDRGKRPQMGQVAAQLADQIVVTDDNPRTEPPEQIIKDILAGIPQQQHVRVQLGRKVAVLDAIANASADDIVVLAGKGHENYQVIGHQRIDYDERAVVADIMRGACA
ncbi:UDP-N-acetylmuramoyl-L-alanyl-D-glutamate--2,6-diaminopimelate ligase [Idiomarina tyrosinivorans]|uniref:UDP-N-acetylmuramoyl-L-alanyl-D-glutamate--2,6-diaminopimelate ligase n=1 Tax=Idiomarina tyrosinivorans TaxID=1445662 RepID=A0A432ZQ64_9GAMM|nr:UDP-N-acetylmuramoyl-L-alanyl-D-glutamate--2,6-diaminopimelate ligase [Idiomarina tyrosinivorans]RUO80085.1 UDP-N-acetylmuramoyl-L-alanyl-D-glutamate--2,6-diaminopimelate ligase [Idiomarina tyrosinivorans]